MNQLFSETDVKFGDNCGNPAILHVAVDYFGKDDESDDNEEELANELHLTTKDGLRVLIYKQHEKWHMALTPSHGEKELVGICLDDPLKIEGGFRCELTLVEPEIQRFWIRELYLPFVPMAGMSLSEIGCDEPVTGHIIEKVQWNNLEKKFDITLEDFQMLHPDDSWEILTK